MRPADRRRTLPLGRLARPRGRPSDAYRTVLTDGGRTTPPPRRRVVLADDDPDVRQALADLLSTDDRLEVVALAGDGIEAVRSCLEHQPDVLVVDVHMPHGGGAHAARELSARLPGLAIIAISANTDRGTRRAMAEAGAAVLVAKDAIAGLFELVVGDGLGRWPESGQPDHVE